MGTLDRFPQLPTRQFTLVLGGYIYRRQLPSGGVKFQMGFRIRRFRNLALFSAIIVLFIFFYRPSLLSSSSSKTPYVRPSVPLGRYDWALRKERYPVTSMRPLPPTQGKKLPRIQHRFPREGAQARKEREKRQKAVKESFLHSWNGYKKHAWLEDEVKPVKGGSSRSFGWATTMIDSLDTLWIMGEIAEFEKAVAALRKEVDLTTIEAETRSIFETTIRHLGGLLAAYDVSGGRHKHILDMAVELADMLYAAFDTPNRMPVNWWRWRGAVRDDPQTASAGATLAEIGSLSLEFTRLSQLTQDPKFFDAVQRIADEMENNQDTTKLPGMWPLHIDATQMAFGISGSFSLGALSDSAYEYLPKEFLMLGGAVDQHRDMYVKAIEPCKEHIFFRPMLPDGIDVLLSGSVRAHPEEEVQLDPEGQHLACFTGAMVDLAAKIFDRPQDEDTARKLVDGCIWAYNSTATGIMPESFRAVPCESTSDCAWNETKWIDIKGGNDDVPPGISGWGDRKYDLRPEAIESVFVHYRITGDTSYQDAAWRMFQAIEKHTRTEIASSAISDVTRTSPEKMDKMESFWLGETLKYFYLIFSEPGLISLDEYVL
ncbi:MAG: hypothetical protein M1837_001077 [Sclerophora amabilis]|nr:MAG: hypothetical protein M1837_001077 [Sclerophora amabilis]